MLAKSGRAVALAFVEAKVRWLLHHFGVRKQARYVCVLGTGSQLQVCADGRKPEDRQPPVSMSTCLPWSSSLGATATGIPPKTGSSCVQQS